MSVTEAFLQDASRLLDQGTGWAGLAGDVMIVGVRDHLEIWALEKWQRYVSRCDPQYDELAETALGAPWSRRPEASEPSTATPANVPEHPR